jgi:hypothetical protein
MSKPKPRQGGDRSEKRKPGRPQERVKLALDFEEAVRGLLATPIEKSREDEETGSKTPNSD